MGKFSLVFPCEILPKRPRISETKFFQSLDNPTEREYTVLFCKRKEKRKIFSTGSQAVVDINTALYSGKWKTFQAEFLVGCILIFYNRDSLVYS